MNLLWRLLYRLQRMLSGTRHWVLRRFAPPGLALLGGLAITAMLGADTENTVAYQVFALLFCLLLQAFLFSWFFRLRFTASRTLPRFGTVGEPFSYRLHLRSLSPRPQVGLTVLEDLADPRPSLKEWRAEQLADAEYFRSFKIGQRPHHDVFQAINIKEKAVATLLLDAEQEVRLELTPNRRGLLHFTGVTLARPDPLGLFRAFSRTPAPQRALILPKRYPLPTLQLPGTLKYQEGGVNLTSNVGQSDEFVSLRDYRRGDPVRHIHWRSWARTGRPIVKEFQDEYFVRHALVLDTFTRQRHSAVFEEAVSVAASFAWAVQTQESLLDLLFVGAQAFCFTTGRGLAHADQMLEILATVQPCGDQSIATLERLMLGHASRLSGCICVLLAWDEERRELVRKLLGYGVPVLALVIVPAGADTRLDPGPFGGPTGRLHALEVGRLAEGLARL